MHKFKTTDVILFDFIKYSEIQLVIIHNSIVSCTMGRTSVYILLYYDLKLYKNYEEYIRHKAYSTQHLTCVSNKHTSSLP